MIGSLILLSTLNFATPVARSVYLNNVNIDQVTAQKFENCTVEIDKAGNIYIVAKGYKVEAAGQTPAPPAQPTPPPPPAAVTKRYWLVTEKPSPGMDEYEIEVYVNNQLVKKVLSKDEQIYLEVSKYMHVGNNVIYVLAKKNISAERKSTTPTHYSRIILGEGDVAGRTIMIDKQLLDYKRTAAEMQNFTDTFNIEGR